MGVSPPRSYVPGARAGARRPCEPTSARRHVAGVGVRLVQRRGGVEVRDREPRRLARLGPVEHDGVDAAVHLYVRVYRARRRLSARRVGIVFGGIAGGESEAGEQREEVSEAHRCLGGWE
jgi:hypothetical protein